jgi:hypothetical protein
VGINLPSADERLHVGGNIRVDDAIYTETYGGTVPEYNTVEYNHCDPSNPESVDCGLCDYDGDNCMPAEVLAGSRLVCPSGQQAVKVISRNQVVCETITPSNVDDTITCPHGVKRVFMNGTVECAPAPP